MCGSCLERGQSGNGCLSPSILFKYEICVDYGGVYVVHVCLICVLFMVLGFMLMSLV